MSRIFVAMPIDAKLRERLFEAARRLDPPLRSLRWTPAQNLHLTLCFIGNADGLAVESARAAVAKTAAAFGPFNIRASGLGAFPPGGAARVLWVGVHDPDKKLQKLAANLRANLKSAGLTFDDKPFRAHLTLGRFGRPEKIDPAVFRTYDAGGEQRAERILLVESQLTPRGSIYSNLADCRLGE